MFSESEYTMTKKSKNFEVGSFYRYPLTGKKYKVLSIGNMIVLAPVNGCVAYHAKAVSFPVRVNPATKIQQVRVGRSSDYSKIWLTAFHKEIK